MTCKNILHTSRDMNCSDSLHHQKECQNKMIYYCAFCKYERELTCRLCLICFPKHEDPVKIESGCYDCEMEQMLQNEDDYY